MPVREAFGSSTKVLVQNSLFCFELEGDYFASRQLMEICVKVLQRKKGLRETS